MNTANATLDKKTTIKDVARVCGVSAATVSYVINGTRVLKADTRERVLRAMEEMNFHPNAAARSLSSKRLHTLGVHCGVLHADQFITNPYAAGILSGILERAACEGFDVTIFTQGWQDMARSAPALLDGRTDGMIVLVPSSRCDMVEGLASLGTPLVTVSAHAQNGIAMVDVDNFAGAHLAARHLIELGHTRIAAILGNRDLASFAPRRAGFCAALREANLEARADWLLDSSFDGSLATQQTRDLLGMSPAPTAICAGNDTIAIAVLEAARELGIGVPEQLSVVGFDDLPVATVVTPALTTIRQPLREIGATATGLLIERVRGESNRGDGRPHLLEPQLIVRGSTSVFIS